MAAALAVAIHRRRWAEFQQVPTKILRIAIWANGAVSILLALSLLLFLISIFKVPPNLGLYMAASMLVAISIIAIPILGISMVVMEFLSRRDRSRGSAGDDAQAESSLGPPP